MSSESEFEEEIARSPNDLAPRLIFADWLDDCGDPRGEWIRTQCELAEINDEHPRWSELVRRDFELQSHVEPRILLRTEALGLQGLGTLTSRGSVEEVTLSAFQWNSHAEKLLAAWPIRHLRFTESTSAVLTNAIQQPSTARLHAVSLSPNLKATGARAVLAAPNWKDLEELNLFNSAIRLAGMKLLADQDFSSLRVLNLTGNSIGSSGVEALAHMRLDNLEKLILDSNALCSEDLFALNESKSLKKLRELDLSGNQRIETLEYYPRLKQIRRLSMRNCTLSADELSQLLNEVLKLEALSLPRTIENGALPFSPLVFEAIGNGKATKGLKELSLAHGRLCTAGLKTLTEGTSLKKLRSLNLGGNGLQDKDVGRLLDSPLAAKLVRLCLANNRLTSKGIKLIAEAKQLKRLTHLDFRNNRRIDDDAAEALANSSTLPNLVSIKAWTTGIGAKGKDLLVDRFGERAVFTKRPGL